MEERSSFSKKFEKIPFYFDKDGVMVWHGVRCVKTPPDKEMLKIYDDLMKEMKRFDEKQDKRRISKDVSK